MRLTNRLTVLAELNPGCIEMRYKRTWPHDAQPIVFNPDTKPGQLKL